MKLVQLLAKELKEWPESAKYITQEDNDGWVTLWYRAKPKYRSGEWVLDRDLDDSRDYAYILHGIDTAEDNKTSIVTQEQWQAEREKMNKPKWIRHRGGKCPVPCGTKVETRHRDGNTYSPHFHTQNSRSEVAMNAVWKHQGDKLDIMAYRIIEQTKDQEIEEVKTIDTAKAPTIECAFGDKDSDPKDLDWRQLGTLTSNLEIDATEATKEIDSLVAKWGQIESPLKWRDEIIELEAYEEEFRREREKLIRKIESEGFKLIDHMAPVYGEHIIDMSDWRNWKRGDIVEVVENESSHSFDIGEEVVVSFVDDKDADLAVKAEHKDGRGFWWLSGKAAKFIRRP